MRLKRTPRPHHTDTYMRGRKISLCPPEICGRGLGDDQRRARPGVATSPRMRRRSSMTHPEKVLSVGSVDYRLTSDSHSTLVRRARHLQEEPVIALFTKVDRNNSTSSPNALPWTLGKGRPIGVAEIPPSATPQGGRFVSKAISHGGRSRLGLMNGPASRSAHRRSISANRMVA